MAINVNNPALILPTESPKFKRPTPKEPKITVKFNHERNVLSLAKNTLGSTRAGNAILLLVDDIVSFVARWCETSKFVLCLIVSDVP